MAYSVDEEGARLERYISPKKSEDGTRRARNYEQETLFDGSCGRHPAL